MALTLSFTGVADIDVNSATFGKFILTDGSSYVANGIALADVIGYFVVDGPEGNIHTGSFASPDITGSVSLVYSGIAIPKDADDNFIQGTYTFSYYVRVSGAVQPGDYEDTGNNFDFCPVHPPLSTVAPLRAAAPCIEVEVNCFCRQITAQDTTDYTGATTGDHEFTLYPPPSLGLPSYVTNALTLTYNFSYSGGYEINVDAPLTYSYGDGQFSINTRVNGSVYKQVNCDIDLCALTTCYNTYRERTLTQAGQYGGFLNLPKADLDKWLRITSAFMAFDNNMKCSNFTEADAIYDELKVLLACNCECDDDTPRLVNPYCSGNNSNSSITVVAAGTGIDVNTTTVGDTTTYTVRVEAAYLSAIATNTADIAALTAVVATLTAGTVGNYRLLENLTTAAGTPANTTETVLQTYSLPSATWNGNGDKIKIKARFTLADNSNVKTMRLYFGSSVNSMAFLSGTSGQPLSTVLEMEVSRTGLNTQDIESWVTNKYLPAKTLMLPLTVGTENLGAAVTIKATGENGTATANDIICEYMTVEYFKKA